MNRTSKIAIAVLLSVTTMLTGGGSSLSQESTPTSATPPVMQEANRAIALYPEDSGPGTFITLEIQPGESAEFSVVFGNAGDIDQELVAYSVPATSAANGGFLPAEREVEPDEPTSWVEFAEAEYVFAPGDGRVLTGTVTVPEDAVAGEYVTAIAAQQSEPFAVEDSATFNQLVRWSLPILIVIRGDATAAFDVTGATLIRDGNLVSAEVAIANTGTLIVRPQGEARLLNADGQVVATSSVSLESVYTGTGTVFYVNWENVPASEAYTVQVNLTAEEGAVTVEKEIPDLVPVAVDGSATPMPDPLVFTAAKLIPASDDTPPSLLMFEGEISNTGEPIENARVSMVTYKDGEEVDRYPIMQAVTIATVTTPVEARYSLPGGFTQGTYTFEVTIETGNAGAQSVLVTQPID